ncbi:YHS domain-containing (seleno)protein [Xanthobacter sp. V3C-3]|uniref:YHS domain-containing (seleno)protein n=1 Tax=Xanthobacter lutulentifluminis TaxID=3119935 RepID=UPI0037289FDA
MTTTHPRRRAFFQLAAAAAIVTAGALGGASLSHAGEHAGAGVELNAGHGGLMLRGYDPVAYFTDAKPVKGSEHITAEYEGGHYYFASKEHKEAFLKDPAKYAPAFGGFCAMGTVFDKKLDGDPMQWKVVDGRLYLNVNADVAKRWNQDVPGNIVKANVEWPKIKDVPAEELNAK